MRRTAMRKPCCEKQDTNKGAWTKQEDQKLVDYIRTHGEGCWRTLPKAAGLHRCGKSCRLRWINYLRPDIKRGNFSPDEEDLIIKLHALLGNRWSLIAGRLPGRTDNEVKNYWNSHVKKKLIRMGIDPNNHRLNQTLPSPRNPCCFSTVITSSGSSDASKPPKTLFADNDRSESDTASCLEDKTIGSRELNLDLTVAVPSLSPSNADNKRHTTELKVTEELESERCPTLLLFR
ncbi:hypothetical protein RJ640_010957 [Escallonia rubra]|uniref:Uncharacterized protein n=1 Tax=Escallonia rubra TaxID=112253 RepID=A0AA88UT34_9ASTE|nr:hypothetical protein RJ640_010957 [Escallonia rubra]